MKLATMIINKISNALAIVSMTCVLILAIMYGADITGRLIFSAQIVGSFEIAQFLLCLITFFAFPYAQKTRSHIHVSFIVSKLPEKVKFIVIGIGFLICTFCGIIMGYALWMQGTYASGVKLSTVLRLPYEPMYYIAAIMIFFFALMLLVDAIRSFMAAAGCEEEKNEINRVFG